jgi:hypothetical protein
MSANIQETIIAFSKTAQSAIGTASTDVIRVNTVSADLAKVEPVVEDDADEIGKGHEFAEESFLTSWKCSRKIEVYNSAEMLAIACAYGLGSGNAGTYSPIDPTTDPNGIDLPLMTFYEGIRPSGTAPVLDRALLDMVVDKFTMSLKSGPGRANSKLTIDLKGSGKKTEPSGLTFPTKTRVHLLPSASLTCAINGTDYVSTKNFVSSDLTWDNNTRAGYFPGSGFQIAGDPTSGAVEGRQEFGKRTFQWKVVARFENGSTELLSLNAQTAGTAVLGLSGGTGFDATITASQTTIKAAEIDNTDGIVTVDIDISCQVPIGGTLADYLTAVVNNSLGLVGR